MLTVVLTNSRFICPSTEVFGTASIIWGVIGPALQFSKGQLFYGKSLQEKGDRIAEVVAAAPFSFSAHILLPRWCGSPRDSMAHREEVPELDV